MKTSRGRIDRKWIALVNTTIGVLMASINSSILLIALPDIFRGIKMDPLAPGNTSYFLWILMGFMLVTSVLVVSLGRVGDMYGRVRMYNLGFAIFTVFSVLLTVTWMSGAAAALWIIAMRVGQGVGAAFLFANSTAILTDAFPENERGLALGIQGVSMVSGSFVGLILGGVLAPIEWHLVFVVSVPFGVLGTITAYRLLEDNGQRTPGSIDWLGNATFALGLVGVLTGIIYGLQPYGGHTMGWTKPFVLVCLFGGSAVLAAFVVVELHVREPMFRLRLFAIRGYTMGAVASLLSALARGGLQFMLIIWLQGIWLPQHGYSFEQTPLWAGIYLVPLSIGFLVSGPLAGRLADRFGSRAFATVGIAVTTVTFALLNLLPINFDYWAFAALLTLMGLSMGLFYAPNASAVMNSLPAEERGAGAGMMNTFVNAAGVLSMGVFFTIVTLGLAASLPSTLSHGLAAQGVPSAEAHQIAGLPPIGLLFASFLGFNPIHQLLPSAAAAHVSAAHYAYLTGRGFFPSLIAGPFGKGLHAAFLLAAAMCLVGVGCSWLRGTPSPDQPRTSTRRAEESLAGAGDVAMQEVGAGSPQL